MNRVKIILTFAKKHHFWVLCIGIVVVGIMLWLGSAAALSSKYDRRKSTLDSKFNSLTAICGVPNHPNQRVIDKTSEAITALKEQVLTSWEHVYEKQKKENPVPNVLEQEFIEAFESLEPGDELDVKHRETYQNFIELHIPTLFKEVDVVRPKSAGTEPLVPGAGLGAGDPLTGLAGGADKSDDAEVVEMTGTVVWDEADRVRLMDRFRWDQTPDTLQVLLAQEDLWVYEALVRIIKSTNEGYTINREAPVKQIDALEIAEDAVESWERSKNTVLRLGAAEDKASSPAGSGAAADDPGAEGEATNLVAGRYVKEDGTPLNAGEAHPYAEYRIMPISMKLVMNQMKIPQLLTECANSSMPIEVRRLRLCPNAVGAVLDLGRLLAAEKGATRAGVSETIWTEAPSGGNLSATLSAAGEAETGPMDLPVEIQGFIYIYNPPDRDKLGTGTAAEKPAEGTATEPAAADPAAAPAAGAPSSGPAGSGQPAPAGG